MCVTSLVKIDREMPVKNPRWPPRNLVFFAISTSDRRDFLRIIEIAFSFYIFFTPTKFDNFILNGYRSIYLNFRFQLNGHIHEKFKPTSLLIETKITFTSPVFFIKLAQANITVQMSRTQFYFWFFRVYV